MMVRDLRHMRRALAALAIPTLAACTPVEDSRDTPLWRAAAELALLRALHDRAPAE